MPRANRNIYLVAVTLATATACGGGAPQSDRIYSGGECYMRTPGNIWPGVQLYYSYGDGYMPAGQIVRIEPDHLFDDGSRSTAVLLQFSDESTGWRRRSALLTDPNWAVRCNDPFLRQ